MRKLPRRQCAVPLARSAENPTKKDFYANSEPSVVVTCSVAHPPNPPVINKVHQYPEWCLEKVVLNRSRRGRVNLAESSGLFDQHSTAQCNRSWCQTFFLTRACPAGRHTDADYGTTTVVCLACLPLK